MFENIINYIKEFFLLVDVATKYFRWPETLTAIFTALTALIAWRVMRIQLISLRPSAFLEFETFDDGLVLKITIRNRLDHPIKVRRIRILKPKYIKLAQVGQTSRGTVDSGARFKSVSYNDHSPKQVLKMDMTLGSAGRGSDSGHREYVVLTEARIPKRLGSGLIDLSRR